MSKRAYGAWSIWVTSLLTRLKADWVSSIEKYQTCIIFYVYFIKKW